MPSSTVSSIRRRGLAMATLLALAALILQAPVLRAGVDRWSPVSAQLTGVQDLVLDPCRPGVLYAAVSGKGIFTSIDGGGDWFPAGRGLPPFLPFRLVAPPDCPGQGLPGPLWALSLFARSTDGGGRWRLLAADGPELVFVHDLVFLPADPARLYATTDGGRWTSSDGGRHWQRLRDGLPFGTLTVLATSPAEPGTLYGAGRSGVWRSPDAGGHWEPVSSFNALREERARLRADPGKPGRLWAVIPAGTLLRSLDGGRTWDTPPAPPLGKVLDLAFAPTEPVRLYVAAERGLFETADGGETWRDRGAVADGPLPRGLAVTSVAVDPWVPGRLWVGVEDRGVFHTASRGGWVPSGSSPVAPPLAAVAISPLSAEKLWAIGNEGTRQRLLRSRDGGATWSREQVLPLNVGPHVLEVDRADGSTLLLGTLQGLFRREVGGGFEPVAGDPAVREAVFDIIQAPGEPGREAPIFAGTLSSVLVSRDGGRTWEARNTGLPSDPEAGAPRVRGLAFGAGEPATLYAATDEGVYHSFDEGGSWSGGSLPPGTACPRSLAADPAVVGTLYLGANFDLWKSEDFGRSWNRVPVFGQESAFVDSILAVDTAPVTLYAGNSGGSHAGCYRSRDGGRSWEAVSAGLYGFNFGEIRVAPGDHRHLLALVGGALYDARFVGARALPLGGGRFRVAAAWWDDTGRNHAATPIPVSAESIGFRFAGPGSLEVLAKLLDGRALTRHFWLFTAGLSHLGYALTVTDGVTGQSHTETHRPGGFLSRADVHALPDFPEGEEGAAAGANGAMDGESVVEPVTLGGDRLLLQGGRFAVEAAWEDPRGGAGTGRGSRLGPGTGFFWFFTPGTAEIAVKIVDARVVDGHFWLFVGSLTDLQVTVTVTDTSSGLRRDYVQPAGKLRTIVDLTLPP